MPRFRFEPLGNQAGRAEFACGVEPLDRYLRTQAGEDVRRRVAACFLMMEGDAVAGYCTLSATSVLLADLPEALTRRAPRYPSLPATLLGRLALDQRYRGHGRGRLLLANALKRSLRQSAQIASYAVVVDAKDEAARRFYERYGFVGLASAGNRLLLPMATITRQFPG